MEDKLTGFVNIFFPEKHFGFIHRSFEGKLYRYFFHISNLMSGTPQTGAVARFNFAEGPKGLYATDVELTPGVEVSFGANALAGGV
jgi:cold shock CspA family protein